MNKKSTKLSPPENFFAWIKHRKGGLDLIKKLSITKLEDVTRKLFDADFDDVQDVHVTLAVCSGRLV